MGDLIQFPKKSVQEQPVSKPALARHFGRSTRWVELMMRDEELPYSRLRNGHTRFVVTDVERWLAERSATKEAS